MTTTATHDKVQPYSEPMETPGATPELARYQSARPFETISNRVLMPSSGSYLNEQIPIRFFSPTKPISARGSWAPKGQVSQQAHLFFD